MTITDEHRVRDLLHSVEPPAASRVDLDRAIAAGRGRRRRRGYLGASGVVAALVLATGAALSVSPAGSVDRPAPAASRTTSPSDPASAGPTRDPASGCSQFRLAAPQRAAHLVPSAIDPTGRYVTGQYIDSAQAEAVLWTDGVPATLPDTSGSGAGGAVDVNSAGVVVGNSADRAWIYRNGVTSRLAVPPGYSVAQVTAVNTRGDAAGTAYNSSRSSIVVWPAGKPDQPVVRPAPDHAEAADIADNGKVVGYIGALDTARPYRWTPEGNTYALPRLSGLSFSYALYINDGWVLGQGVARSAGPAAPDTVVPLRWRLNAGTVERVPGIRVAPGQHVNALAVGADGRVAVQVEANVTIVPGSSGGLERAFPLPPTLRQVTAAVFTTYGFLLAGVTDEDPAKARPVLWHC